MHESFHKDTYTAKLSRKERQVLDALVRVKGPLGGVELAKLVGFPYRRDSFRVLVSQIRAKLRGTGWTVSSNVGGAETGLYSVVRS